MVSLAVSQFPDGSIMGPTDHTPAHLMSLNSLPEDLVRQIFVCLTLEDWACSVAPVSRAWSALLSAKVASLLPGGLMKLAQRPCQAHGECNCCRCSLYTSYKLYGINLLSNPAFEYAAQASGGLGWGRGFCA